jgi:hypothetical protein
MSECSWKSRDSLADLKKLWGVKSSFEKSPPQQKAHPSRNTIVESVKVLTTPCSDRASNKLSIHIIPIDILIQVCFPFVSELESLMTVCTSWYTATHNDMLWRDRHLESQLFVSTLCDEEGRSSWRNTTFAVAPNLQISLIPQPILAHTVITSNEHFAMLCCQGRHDAAAMSENNAFGYSIPQKHQKGVADGDRSNPGTVYSSESTAFHTAILPCRHVYKPGWYFLSMQGHCDRRSVSEWHQYCLGYVWRRVLGMLRAHLTALLRRSSIDIESIDTGSAFGGMSSFCEDVFRLDTISKSLQRLSVVSESLVQQCLIRELELQRHGMCMLLVGLINPKAGAGAASASSESMRSVMESVCQTYKEWHEEVIQCEWKSDRSKFKRNISIFGDGDSSNYYNNDCRDVKISAENSGRRWEDADDGVLLPSGAIHGAVDYSAYVCEEGSSDEEEHMGGVIGSDCAEIDIHLDHSLLSGIAKSCFSTPLACPNSSSLSREGSYSHPAVTTGMTAKKKLEPLSGAAACVDEVFSGVADKMWQEESTHGCDTLMRYMRSHFQLAPYFKPCIIEDDDDTHNTITATNEVFKRGINWECVAGASSSDELIDMFCHYSHDGENCVMKRRRLEGAVSRGDEDDEDEDAGGLMLTSSAAANAAILKYFR